MSLSICIPTVPRRKSLLSRMLFSLEYQPDGAWEVLVYGGDGRMGDKVNRMFELAQGSHVVVFDDDDWVSDRYIETVLPYTERDFDHVGYPIVVMVDGRFESVAQHPHVSHKCPVRATLARKVTFGNEYTDDKRWAATVERLVRRRVHIDRPMYYYDFWNRVGNEHGAAHRSNVGRWPYSGERYRWL